MSRFRSSISKTGPFFTHDPVLTFDQNLREMLGAAEREGVADITGRLRSQPGELVSELHDRVADHVIGMVPDSRTMVVFIANRGYSEKQATSLMAAASEKERRGHAWRQTAARMRASRAVNRAELAKGLT